MNTISFQDVYQTSTAAAFKLGQRAMTADGREWRFVTSTTLASGNIAVPVAVASSDLYSSSTDSQGRIVYATRAANAFTIGQFEDAIGVVDDGTGVGQTFKIRTNDATTFTLYPETALGTALAVASSDLTYIGMARCRVAAITSKIQMTQGGAQVAFTTNDYGWLLQRGDGRVLAGEALTVGGSFVSGDDTTGQVVKGTTAKGEFDEQTLGYAIVANAAADQGALVRFNVA